MGPDDRRLGGKCGLDVEDHIGRGDLESAFSGLGLPQGLEVERVGRHPTKMLDRLLARPEAEGVRFEPEGCDGGGCEQGVAVSAGLGGGRPLEEAVDEDDVGSGQLVATGDATADERPVMDEELEIEAGSQPARVAVAARGLVDAAEASTEGQVRRLDRIEEQRPVGASVLDEQEGRIAFELHQPERRFETTDDRLEKVAGDDRGVLDLTPREIGGIARQVGDDQEASLGCRCHARQARPWSRSNVKTPWAASPYCVRQTSAEAMTGLVLTRPECMTAIVGQARRRPGPRPRRS